jgi:small subunit ribosomal protein S4e
MARGPKKHMKRLTAPKSWMLNKLGGTWAPRPSTGPHKIRESLPLMLALRNRLKYALTRREAMMIVMRRLIEVDGKVRTDLNFPAGLMDVLRIPRTDENYRLLFDTKGHYTLTPIDNAEASFKLLKVLKVARGKKSTVGRNPTHGGQSGAVPYVVTHDGRTIRYPDPSIRIGDTIKFDIKSGKILGFAKFEAGNVVLVTKGANIGRVGTIVSREKHPGSFEIVHLKDSKDNTFATRSSNIFILGQGDKSWIKLPKANGIKLSILEQKQQRATQSKAKKTKKAKKDKKDKKDTKKTTTTKTK